MSAAGVAAAAGTGGVAVAAAAGVFLAGRRSPPRLVRTNVRGAAVPAVLGFALSLGALAGLALGSLLGGGSTPVGAAAGILIVALTAAGAADDRRGREGERGFAGHLRAAAQGRITGGVVKIAAGVLASLTAAAVALDSPTPAAVLEVGLIVALTANLFNLLDRAPGRAGKVGLIVGVPLVVAGSAAWLAAGAGLLGAIAGIIGFDLRERAMLGDAGSNPLGAVLGLGLGVSLGEPWRLLCALVLVALNAASERWSYSEIIESTSWLRALDSWGRRG